MQTYEDSINIRGHVVLELVDEFGNVKHRTEQDNVICTQGKTLIMKASGGKLPAAFNIISIGSGSTAATAADTAMQTVLANSSAITPTNPSANITQFVYSFPPGTGTGTINEVGLLDAAAGNIVSHIAPVASPPTKAGADTLNVTYTLTW